MSRIELICNTAAILFIQQGYSKTQISHIADAVGVSVGTIYHDFKGKDEIKNLILKCSIDRSFINADFVKPINNDIFLNLEDEILENFTLSSKSFSSHLDDNAKAYDFETLISDSFDMLSKYAVGCLFIEKNKKDCGIIYNYYMDYRKSFFSTMEKYLEMFIEKGELRSIKHLDLTATMIIEILTWWAMDIRYSSFETIKISPETAKEVCIDNIVSAYRRG